MPGFTMPTRVVSEWLLVSATIILEQSLESGHFGEFLHVFSLEAV